MNSLLLNSEEATRVSAFLHQYPHLPISCPVGQMMLHRSCICDAELREPEYFQMGDKHPCSELWRKTLSSSFKAFLYICLIAQTLSNPWTVAHQAPLSMGFSSKEYWSGLPCPSSLIYINTLKWELETKHSQCLCSQDAQNWDTYGILYHNRRFQWMIKTSNESIQMFPIQTEDNNIFT